MLDSIRSRGLVRQIWGGFLVPYRRGGIIHYSILFLMLDDDNLGIVIGRVDEEPLLVRNISLTGIIFSLALLSFQTIWRIKLSLALSGICYLGIQLG